LSRSAARLGDDSQVPRGGRPVGWEISPAEEAKLQAAFTETAKAVGEAFAVAVGLYGCEVRGPRFGTNPDDPVSRFVSWWVDIPSPYEDLSCELDLLSNSGEPEVSGRIAVWKYIGRGFSDNDDLWRSDNLPVESPTAAAATLRQVGADLVRQCGSLELRPYFARETAPGEQVDAGV
jgi:hypothetical protein